MAPSLLSGEHFCLSPPAQLPRRAFLWAVAGQCPGGEPRTAGTERLCAALGLWGARLGDCSAANVPLLTPAFCRAALDA